jgi:hypothetical protein
MTTVSDDQIAADQDLAELARRFPEGFVERKDGNDYVAHHIVNQRLLTVVGPFDFELVEVIRGDVPPVSPDAAGRSRRSRAGTPALHNAVVGGVWRLTCTVGGRRVRIEEVGDVGDVHNWPHDGARLKDAASDALKRCAMRLGLGLHLWAQEHYFLDHQLRAGLAVQPAEEAAAGRAGESDRSPGRMPVRGTPGWDEPPADLVASFESLVDAAGVSQADAAGFLRRSPYYSGVADARELHAPALARLVDRLGETDGDEPTGLTAFRAAVEESLAAPAA